MATVPWRWYWNRFSRWSRYSCPSAFFVVQIVDALVPRFVEDFVALILLVPLDRSQQRCRPCRWFRHLLLRWPRYSSGANLEGVEQLVDTLWL